MDRYNSLAAMDIRQHVGVSLSPHPLHQLGALETAADDSLEVGSRFSNAMGPSSRPMDFGSIHNPSHSSNSLSEFSSSLFDCQSSQSSFGRHAGSATLIPLSQSQTMPAKGGVTSEVMPADEWSETTFSGPGTPSTQQHQQEERLRSPPDPGLTTQADLQPNQQFLYEGRLITAAQTVQSLEGDKYQLVMCASQQSGVSQGNGILSLSGGPSQGPMQSQLGDAQESMDISVPIVDYPVEQSVKYEFNGIQRVKLEYGVQESHPEALMSSQDSACQEGSFHGPISSNQQLGMEMCPTGSLAQADMKDNLIEAIQNQMMGSVQDGEISSLRPGFPNGVEGPNFQQPIFSHECCQPGLSRLQVQFESTQQLLNRQSSFQCHQSLQSLRSLELMQGVHPRQALQSQGASAQQSIFAGSANQFAHLQRAAASQASLMHIAPANQLSPYQFQEQEQAQVQAQAQARARAQAQAQAQSQAQAQGQAMVHAHAQAQAANQQAALQLAFANQVAMMQARQSQQGGSGLHQQLLYHPSHQQQIQSGQARAFHVMNGLQLTGAAQQMLARMQPGMQNQFLQGLNLGHHLLQGLGNGFGCVDDRTRSPMPPALASECNRIIMLYIQEQRKRPLDNNISFWKNLVQHFFEPGALKRWCLSNYNMSPVGRHAEGLFPMEFWFCNLCGVQPGRGFDICTDVLPRLCKIKYDSGLQDEILFIDVADERYILPSGKMVLEYSRAVYESVFADLRVVRYGKLRVTFSFSLKIQAWEFCSKSHEEVVPCKNLLEQAEQLGNLVVEAGQENFDRSVQNLTKHCNAFTSTARQLAVKLDSPMVNDLGFSKRYVRCLQISEVVNSMKDLMSFEKQTGDGPIQSLERFPSARKLHREGLLTNVSSITQLIHHLTQGSPLFNHYGRQASGQIDTRHPGLLFNIPNGGQQHISQQFQGHLSQMPPGTMSEGHRDPTTMANFAQLSNYLKSQLRSQTDAHQFAGLVGCTNNQMQPPGYNFQAAGNSPVVLSSGIPRPGHSMQVSLPRPASLSGGNSLPFFDTQIHLQLNHAQALCHLQGQSSTLSGAPPGINQQTFQTNFSNQIQPQYSQSHSLSHVIAANGGQQSLPGTPQSEISDLRSNV